VYVCRTCRNHLAVGESVLSKVSVYLSSSRETGLVLFTVIAMGKKVVAECVGTGDTFPSSSSLSKTIRVESVLLRGRRAVHMLGGNCSQQDPPMRQYSQLIPCSNSPVSTVEHFSYGTRE
jgi:hypothetical protein